MINAETARKLTEEAVPGIAERNWKNLEQRIQNSITYGTNYTYTESDLTEEQIEQLVGIGYKVTVSATGGHRIEW